MSSKIIVAIAALILVGGGIIAVRSLTSTENVIETSDARTNGPGEESEGAGAEDTEPSTRISSTRDSDSSSQRTASGRTFSRGEGAAAIDVTPATTTPEQLATIPVVTPETTSTEEALEEQRAIADLVSMFRNKTDPEERVEIADELGMIDNPEAIKSIVELLKEEQDPLVQAALLEAMQGLDALEATAPEVLDAIRDIYSKTEDIDVQIAAQDLLGDIANADATNVLREIRNTEDPVSRLNITENLMRVWAAEPDLIPRDELAMYNGQVQQEYEGANDPEYRSQAIMALAINGRENLEFFQTMLQTEQDPQLRQLLERFVRMYSGAPATGATATPAPTPVQAQ